MSDDATLDEFAVDLEESNESDMVAESKQTTDDLQTLETSPIENWELLRLGKVLSFEYGDNLPADTRQDGEIPVYGSNGQIDTHTEANVDRAGIIIGRKGSIGEGEFSNEPFWAIDTTYYISSEETDENLRFIHYLLQDMELERLNAASAIPGLNRNDAYNLNTLVPPLSEQRKIATVLHTVDQAIQKTEEIIEQTKRVQTGVERRLFREGHFDHPNIDEKRLVTIPKDWDFDQLSKHTKNSAFGPRFGSERYDDEGNISTLRTTDLNDRGHISLETMPVADLEVDEIEDHLLEPGDFMITRSGTTGIGTVWKGHNKPTIPGAFLIRFRFEDSLNPNFMKCYVNSSIGRSRVNRRAKGGVQKNLAGSDLLNMRFPIPNKNEQRKIVDILGGFEERIQHERKYNYQLKHLKQGLMQDLLSGTVRTTDTNIEVPDSITQHG